jgi:hypothetical protein
MSGEVVGVLIAAGVVLVGFGVVVVRLWRKVERLEADTLYLAESQVRSAEALRKIQQAMPNIGGDIAEIMAQIDRLWKRIKGDGDKWKY